MSSSSNNPKPSVATGYTSPSSDTTNGGAAPSSTANGVPAATAYPYYPPNPNPNAYYYPPNPNPNPNPNAHYYAPNPNPNPNSYYYHQNPNPNRNLFFRRLFIIFVAAFITLGAATLIVYLVLRPKLPSFTLSSLSVSSLNLSTDSISSSFDLSFTVENPNSKMTVAYDRIFADVVFGENSLASTSLAPFSQSKGNVTTISAKMAATDEFVDADATSAIRSGRASGVVKFDVRVVAVVNFRSGAWRMRRHQLRVFCGGAGVSFRNGSATAGSMTNGPRPCWVGI